MRDQDTNHTETRRFALDPVENARLAALALLWHPNQDECPCWSFPVSLHSGHCCFTTTAPCTVDRGDGT